MAGASSVVSGAVASILIISVRVVLQLPATSAARTWKYQVPSAVCGAVQLSKVQSATGIGSPPGVLSKSLLYIAASPETTHSKVGNASALHAALFGCVGEVNRSMIAAVRTFASNASSGESRSTLSPRPSWPDPFLPHTQRPPGLRAPTWSFPETTALQSESVSYTHLRAHETRHDLVCRLLLEKKKK